MQSRSAVTLVVVAILAAAGAAPASAAKPKLYSVSLSGSARNEITDVQELPRPLGCMGTVTETQHFVGSAGLAAKPKGTPFASYGRLQFNVGLTSPTATETDQTTGSWAVDPSQPFPPDPSTCASTPVNKTSTCTFSRLATRKQGAQFAILPLQGKFEFYFNVNNVHIVSCDPDPLGVDLLGGTVRTKLRSSTVKALAKGHSAVASATSVTPTPGASSSRTGGETVRYTLKVKRVS